MNISIICKISIINIIFLYQVNSFADFKDEIPNNFKLDSPATQIPANPNSNNTIRKKYENDKKDLNNKNNLDNSSNKNNDNFDFTKHNSNEPVFFKGDTAEGSRKTGILNLIGNVEIKQDDTKLTSDKAQLFGSTGSTLGSGSKAIHKAIATGNVKVNKKSSENTPEMKAVANTIEFLVPQRIMILKGKAKVWKAQEYINAEYIEINLNSGDIKLKDPHGTFDPKATSNANKPQ